MPIPFDDLMNVLCEAFPDAHVSLVDLAGDNDHYQATIISKEFIGKSRIQQHQMVYAALKGKMAQELHALSLNTKTPTV